MIAKDDPEHHAQRTLVARQFTPKAVQRLGAEIDAIVTDLVDAWNEKATAIEQVAVPLERSDVAISAACVLWVPMG